MTTDPLELAREIASRLPTDAVADWDNTNHYELSGTWNGEYTHAWIDLWGSVPRGMACDTEIGKRVGAVMDAAAAFPVITAALIDAHKQIEALRATLEFYADANNHCPQPAFQNWLSGRYMSNIEVNDNRGDRARAALQQQPTEGERDE